MVEVTAPSIEGAGILGYIVGIGGTLFAAYASVRRAKVDDTVAATAAWKALLDQHTADLSELRDELRKERDAARQEREDNSKLRKRLGEAEDEIASLKTEIAGLRRQIAQMGQSSLMVLGGSPDAEAMQRAMQKIEGPAE